MLKKIIKSIKRLFHPHEYNNHRAKLLYPKSFFIVTFLALVVFEATQMLASYPSKGHILGYASFITAEAVVDKTNAERKKLGLPELKVDQKLNQAALAKAQNMFTEDYWAHNSPKGLEPWFFIKNSGYEYQVAGENLARDFMDTDSMVVAWMNSPTHKANIVHTKYQDIGVAVVNGSLGSIETTLVVQMFGTKIDNTNIANKKAQSIIPSVSAEDLNEPIETDVEIKDNANNVVVEQNPTLALNQTLISPSYILKSFFLGILLLFISVLAYDHWIAGHRDTMRLVGKNLAHIMLFVTVLIIILINSGGKIDF